MAKGGFGGFGGGANMQQLMRQAQKMQQDMERHSRSWRIHSLRPARAAEW